MISSARKTQSHTFLSGKRYSAGFADKGVPIIARAGGGLSGTSGLSALTCP